MAANERPNGLDDVDRGLLTELQADARLSLAELGRRTEPAVLPVLPPGLPESMLATLAAARV